MQPTIYGYIRVSAKDQNEDRQRIALLIAGVEAQNIILDKQSGKILIALDISDYAKN